MILFIFNLKKNNTEYVWVFLVLTVPITLFGELIPRLYSGYHTTIELRQRVTWFGRHPDNHVSWGAGSEIFPIDYRIPEHAMRLAWMPVVSKDIEEYKKDPQAFNWVKLDQYVPIVQAGYPKGRILVNGVALDQIGGRTFGRLFTGDTITILSPEATGSGTPLEFGCWFPYGPGRRARTTPFIVERSSFKL